MKDVKTKKKRGKRSRNINVEKIIEAKPLEEVLEENKEVLASDEKEHNPNTAQDAPLVETGKMIEKLYVIKGYDDMGQEENVGFAFDEEEAKKYCDVNNKLRKREGAYVYEELNSIHVEADKTKPYYQHQVRFMIRNELPNKPSHLKFDGKMCIEPNSFVKYIGVRQSDDVLLFHNVYVTTLSIRTVQDTREQAENHAKKIYEMFMMYYSMTNNYVKAHELLLAKLGIKDSEAVLR